MDNITAYFENPNASMHRQYEALRAYLYEKAPAKEVSKKFGYSVTTLYCLANRIRKQLQSGQTEPSFFVTPAVGRPTKKHLDKTDELIIALRKKYLSVSDVKAIIDTQETGVSESYIYNVLKREGFARLPRRSKQLKSKTEKPDTLEAPTAALLNMDEESFGTTHIGLLCFLPCLIETGLAQLITESAFPETKTIPKINSILSFVALKLSNIKRYTSDDLWCMDRGCGLFAGLTVLPKAAWFASYSHRVTREMNIQFLKAMHELWHKTGLLSDTANIDFVSIPYWGDDSHLENNWSGTRHQALSSILAAIAQDPETGIITYGDTTLRHDNESSVVVEFLDFYKSAGGNDLKYLVFDSKFTTYENMSKLDDNGVNFVTIRRRGKNIVESIEQLPPASWKKVRVATSFGKTRLLKVNDTMIKIKAYSQDKEIRQIAITGHGKIKPALIITNDFDIKTADIIRKYARRWLVEKTISEQTHFFHLNRISSSMVIKVDFDLTMTILAHNLYRLLARELVGYEHFSANSLYEKFICNNGSISINGNEVIATMKKKRNLPELLTRMHQRGDVNVPWLGRCKLSIEAASNT